jgi:hypothetical protein
MPIRTLAEAISHYGREAYLLTVAKDGPHTSNVTVAEITFTKSVLHRPGPKPDNSDGPCTSDCCRLT